jgi:RHH-type rel operon transcriptional repressor/antitoxin RelB
MNKNEVVLSVRIPAELKKQIDEIAKITERPKSYFVKKALESYFEDIADYAEALDRYTEKNARYLSTEEVKKQIGL